MPRRARHRYRAASIRIPAGVVCGTVGLKAEPYGRVSRTGVMPNSFTFDHAGPADLDRRGLRPSSCQDARGP